MKTSFHSIKLKQ